MRIKIWTGVLVAALSAVVASCGGGGGGVDADDPAFAKFARLEVAALLAGHKDEQVGADELRQIVADSLAFRADCRAIYRALDQAGGLDQPDGLVALSTFEPTGSDWKGVLDVLQPQVDAADVASIAKAIETNCAGLEVDPEKTGRKGAAVLGAPPT